MSCQAPCCGTSLTSTCCCILRLATPPCCCLWSKRRRSSPLAKLWMQQPLLRHCACCLLLCKQLFQPSARQWRPACQLTAPEPAPCLSPSPCTLLCWLCGACQALFISSLATSLLPASLRRCNCTPGLRTSRTRASRRAPPSGQRLTDCPT